MRTSPFQMNFTNGEISPLLFDRFDLEKYWNSVEEMENFLILPYGGVRKRPGFHYVCAQGDETRKARLIPFIFSTEQAYIIEAGHEYFRFFMNHGLIMAEDDPDTVLLLHMNGTNGSQTFTDESGSELTVTAQGTAQVTTAQSKFGGGSCYIAPGGTAYLEITDDADLDFSADDVFTIECWIWPAVAEDQDIFYFRSDDDNRSWIRTVANGGGGSGARIEFRVVDGGASQDICSDDASISAGVWTHIRVVGDGTKYYLFINGELQNSALISSSMKNYTANPKIGKVSPGYWGYIDEFRISKVARSTTSFTPQTSQYAYDGGDVYEVETPYQEADLERLQFFSSFDTMYICHPDYAWRKLTRTGHAAWTLTTIAHTNGPWLEEQQTPVFTATATTGNITVTSDADYFSEDHVGAYLRLYINGSWGYVQITAFTGVREVSATVIATLGAADAADKYQECAWSGVYGYPTTGCFNEGSLVLMGNNNQPQTVWASVKGDYENFEVGTDDDDAFTYTIPASNRIVSNGHLQNMVILTSENAAWKMPVEVNKGIYTMSGGSDDYISPSNVRVRASLSSSLLYWQKGSLKLRELAYDPNSYYLDNYNSPDMTILAEHITEGGIVYSAWQQEPYSILWNNRTDGVLATMSYMRAENIVGWARQVTDGVVESVAVIPDPTDTFNEVWISVKRTIDGTEQRYIEYYDPNMFVDSGIAFTGIALDTITGLDHLEGKTVSIVYEEDGGYLYDEGEVSGGEIALDPALNVLQVGLPITATLKTIKPVISGDGNTTAGLPANWVEIYVSLYQTSGLTVNDEEIVFDTEGVTGDPYPMTGFSGNRKVSQLGWGDGNITIVHDAPLPCTILGLFGKLSVG